MARTPQSTILMFLKVDVQRLIDHAATTTLHEPTYDQLYEPQFHKPGVKIGEDEFPTAEQIDMAKIPPGLFLVKDSGIYLMSNGFPRLPTDGKHVVYAQEPYDHTLPSYDWDAGQRIMGGDDVVIHLALDFLADGMKSDEAYLRLRPNHDKNGLESISMMFRAEKPV